MCQDFIEIIEKILKRPLMYLGNNDLSNLNSWISGYFFAINNGALGSEDQAFSFKPEFDDWVAYKLHYFESTSGWANMISSKHSDTQDKYDIFQKLLLSFFDRKEKIVGIIDDRGVIEQLDLGETSIVKLVKYSEDPGYFIVSDGSTHIDGFYSNKEILENFTGIPFEKWSCR